MHDATFKVPASVLSGSLFTSRKSRHHALDSQQLVASNIKTYFKLSCSCSISNEDCVSRNRMYDAALNLTSELNSEVRRVSASLKDDVVPTNDLRANG